MKPILLLALAAGFLLASCSSSDSTISGRQRTQDPVSYDVEHLTNGNPTRVYDSIYIVSPSYSQKFKLAVQRHDLVWFFVFLGLMVVLICFGFYKSQNQRTASSYGFLIYFFLAIVAGCLSANSIDWEHTKQADIPKTTYDSLMKADGNLKAFWDQNLGK